MPFVIAVNPFDGQRTHEIPSIREAVQVDDHVPMLWCDARHRGDVKNGLIALVELALRERTQQTVRLIRTPCHRRSTADAVRTVTRPAVSKGAHDVRLAFRHVLVGELEHGPPHLLQLVAATRVLGAIGGGRVPASTRHLDDDSCSGNRKSTRATSRPSRRWTTCVTGIGSLARRTILRNPRSRTCARPTSDQLVQPLDAPAAPCRCMRRAAR